MSKKQRRKKMRSAAPATAPSATIPSEMKGARADLPRRNPIEAFFFGGLDPVRPFLLLRATLVLLAFDCWIDLIPHGGRYGVGGFNIAHFAILDLLPVPTPAVYVGGLLMTGILALVMAVRPWRPGLGALFALYTYGWASSMLDSYQHHYLLSLVLFSFAFFPTPTGTVLLGAPQRGDRRRRIAGVLLALGVLEVVGRACGVATPLGAISDASWMVGLQCGLVVAGGLLLFLESSDERTREDAPPLTSAFAYVSVTVTCAIVYFYTAITKLAPDWRDGAALRRLGNSEAFQSLERSATTEGLPLLGQLGSDDFWAWMARGAILVQLVSAAGFLAAARQDSMRPSRRWLVMALGLAPLSFHIGTERMGLEIGWFSYYMLMITVVVFSPASALRAVVDALTWPARRLRVVLGSRADVTGYAWGSVAVGAAVSAIGLEGVDLPGSSATGILLAVTLVAVGVHHLRTDRLAAARSLGLGLAGATLLAVVSLTYSDVRFDYYRFVGGDHRRRGETEEALEAYVKAQRYCRRPWCVERGREEIACFREESQARSAAAELGDGVTVRPVDRREKVREMRELLGRSAEE